jgi:hypothetical protein
MTPEQFKNLPPDRLLGLMSGIFDMRATVLPEDKPRLTTEEKLERLGVRQSIEHREHALKALALIEERLTSGEEQITVKRQLIRELHSDMNDDEAAQVIGGFVLAAWNHETGRFQDELLGVS